MDDQYPYGLEYAVNKLDEQIHFDVCVINYYYLSRLFEFIHIPKKAIVTHDCIAYKNLKVGTPTMCITADTEAKAMQRCPHIFALQEVEACYFNFFRLIARCTIYMVNMNIILSLWLEIIICYFFLEIMNLIKME